MIAIVIRLYFNDLRQVAAQGWHRDSSMTKGRTRVPYGSDHIMIGKISVFCRFWGWFCLAVACVLLPVQAYAESVTIHAIEIPGLYQPDGKGDYNNVLDALRPNLGTDYRIVVESAAMAFSGFENCADCCISPANRNPEFYPYQDGFLETMPMNRADIYIWTAPGMPIIDNIAALKGKKVGARIGFPYGQSVEHMLNLQRVKSIETNINLLEAGRIDAMIDYVPDTYTVFERLGKKPFPHNAGHPVLSHNDAILCHDTPRARDFVSEFDRALPAAHIHHDLPPTGHHHDAQ